jgi:hypothetical protein
VDRRRFDEFALTVAGVGSSRRAALRALGAALLWAAGTAGFALGDEAAAKGCSTKGKRCERDGQCCSRRCRKGACARCPKGTKACGHTCVRTKDDPKHCGGCGRRCVAGQACVGGACRCGGARCDGCCDGEQCLAVGQQTDGQCGSGGAACAACGGDQDCVGGVCTCTAASCPTGCCAGATCESGTTRAFCGAGGGACAACGEGEDCIGGDCVAACNPCRVFVTSTTHQGDLGGLAGADAICQARAGEAGLPGTYLAWLSDDAASPATRFPTHSAGPYELVDGTTIADDWADLTSGDLDAPINLTETGGSPGDESEAWTHTEADGTASFGVPCNNWTSNSSEDYAAAGTVSATGAEWTRFGGDRCQFSDHLYCVQQS